MVIYTSTSSSSSISSSRLLAAVDVCDGLHYGRNLAKHLSLMLGKGGLEEALRLRLSLYSLDVRKNILHSTFNICQTIRDICPSRRRGCESRRILCVCV